MFFAKREQADAEAKRLLVEDPRVAGADVQLEPDNGWIIVVIPRLMDLSDLYGKVEVRGYDGRRISPRNPNKKVYIPQPKPSSGAASGGPTPTPQGTGATAKVHQIASAIHAANPLTSRARRSEIINECIKQGVNESTAATQIAKWFKNNGL